MGTGQRQLHKLSHRGMDEHGVEEHGETLLIIGVLINISERKCGHSCALKSRPKHDLIVNSKVIVNLGMSQRTL